jgi:hypothetical protein
MLTKQERERLDLANFSQKCAASVRGAAPTALALNPVNQWSQEQLNEVFTKSVQSVIYLCNQVDNNDIDRFIRFGDGSFQKATQGIIRDHSFDPKQRRNNCAVLLKKSVCTGDLTAHEKHLVIALNNNIQEILSNNGNRVSDRFADKIADFFAKGRTSKQDIKDEVNKEIMFQAMENLVWSPQGKLLDYVKAPAQYNPDTEQFEFSDYLPEDLQEDGEFDNDITTSVDPQTLSRTAPSQVGQASNVAPQGNDIDLILNALHPKGAPQQGYGDNTQLSLNRRVIAGDGDSDIMKLGDGNAVMSGVTVAGDGSDLASRAMGSLRKFAGIQSKTNNPFSPDPNLYEGITNHSTPPGLTKHHGMEDSYLDEHPIAPRPRFTGYEPFSEQFGDGRNDIVGADGSPHVSGTINGDEVTNGVLKAVEGFLGRAAGSTMGQMATSVPDSVQSGIQGLAGTADAASLASPMGRAGQSIGAMVPQGTIDAATKPLAAMADNLASRAMQSIGNLGSGDQSANFIHPGLE